VIDTWAFASRTPFEVSMFGSMLVLMLAAGGLVARTPSMASLDSALTAAARQGFSGVVLVARRDTVLLDQAYGDAAALGVDPGDLAFWLASDSKQFTATAIQRLAEVGRLSPGDSLPRFFADVPPDARAITIEQLLTHTSGLGSSYVAEGIADRAAAVRAILARHRGGKPGERYEYSNDGYNLLAAIVEQASGVPFDRYLTDSLFAHADLTHTGVWGDERAGVTIAPLFPRQPSHDRKGRYEAGHSVPNWGMRGPGGCYASANDLLAWLRALRGGRLLGRDAFGDLVGHHVLLHSEASGASYVAHGWSVRVEGGRDVSYAHVGDDDWLGHSSVIRWDAEGDVVIVLANSGERGDEGWASAANRLVRQFHDPR
jgi:CubicO group peptidase (beta-lactamase class C family)